MYYNHKRLSFLIQTNKPLYKADDVVKFRIFAIDSATKPYQFISPNIEIHAIDANNNRIKRWANISFERGIFESEFKLSNNPLSGFWWIWVDGDDEVIFFALGRPLVFMPQDSRRV